MSWMETLTEIIDEVGDDLAVVMNATGCRERWLQAEFYRRLIGRDSSFAVDKYAVTNYSKADLYGELHGPMVAEIKVFGTNGYYRKNVAGTSDISPWLPRTADDRVVVTDMHLTSVNENENSLLKDFKRLQLVPDTFQRFLILIVHKNGPIDDLGRAMLAIKFPGDELDRDYPGFHLRIWHL